MYRVQIKLAGPAALSFYVMCDVCDVTRHVTAADAPLRVHIKRVSPASFSWLSV